MKKFFIFFLFVLPQLCAAQYGIPENITNPLLPELRQYGLADFDSDGDLDVFSLNVIYSPSVVSNIHIVRNTNNGFALSQRINTNQQNNEYGYLKAIDLDGDSDIDISVYSKTLGKIFCYLNDGTGEFGGEILLYASLTNLKAVNLDDLNNDGLPEIVFMSSGTNSIRILKNNGGLIFSNAGVLASNIIPLSNTNVQESWIQFNDVNGDGLKEVYAAFVYLGTDAGIFQFSNNGNFNFGAPQMIHNVNILMQFSFNDMNSDNFKDLVVAEDANLQFYFHNGVSSFGTSQSMNVQTSVKSYSIIDMDNDTHMDIVFNNQTDSVAWRKNNGQGQFISTELIFKYGNNGFVLCADLDADGNADVLYLDKDEKRIDYFTNESVGFSYNKSLLGQIGANMIEMDVDGDGLTDILSAFQTNPMIDPLSTKLVWYKNLGTGKFSGEILIQTCNTLELFYNNAIQKVDIDADGDGDIVFSTNSYGGINWFENLGGGSFSPPAILYPTSSSITLFHFGDIDNDGDPDVMFQTSPSTMQIRKNDGNNNFIFSQNLSFVLQDFRFPEFSDSNNDGLLDIVFINSYNASKPLRTCLNQGNGSFASYGSPMFSGVPVNLFASEDLDLDGDDDYIIHTDELPSKCLWVENIGGTSFGTPIIINSNVNLSATSAEFADINNDGLKDIVYNNTANFVYHLNLGNGSFTALDTLFDMSISPLFFDVEQDGDEDIVYSKVSDVGYYPIGNIILRKNLSIDAFSLKGSTYLDANQNGFRELGEVMLSAVPIGLSGSNITVSTNNSGLYNLNLADIPFGPKNVEPFVNSLWSVTSVPNPFSFSYTQMYTPIDSVDFGFFPANTTNDIQIDVTNGLAGCNQMSHYWVNVKNTGNTIASGIVKISLDDSVQFLSSSILPDSIIGQDIYWHYDSLFYYSDVNFSAMVLMPSVISIGDTLNTLVMANMLNNIGSSVFAITDTTVQIVTCAYDPNDKQVLPQGDSIPGYIPLSTTELEYTIRFQNTGTDTATNVVVKDYLDSKLDWSTFQVISSSHDQFYEMKPNGEVVFNFLDIHLPDSGSSFIASQGYVKFIINCISGLMEGDQIKNTARIYFDANPAIITNTCLNTFKEPTIIDETSLSENLGNFEFLVFPNPFEGIIRIESEAFAVGLYEFTVYDIQGKKLFHKKAEPTNIQSLNLQYLENGIYFVDINNNELQDSKATFKIVKQ